MLRCLQYGSSRAAIRARPSLVSQRPAPPRQHRSRCGGRARARADALLPPRARRARLGRRRSGVPRLARGTHRPSVRGRSDAPARGERLDAQPRAHGGRELSHQGSRHRLASGRALRSARGLRAPFRAGTARRRGALRAAAVGGPGAAAQLPSADRRPRRATQPRPARAGSPHSVSSPSACPHARRGA